MHNLYRTVKKGYYWGGLGGDSKFCVVDSKKWISEEYLNKKTHIASALAIGGSSTECVSDNGTAESVGTLCVVDDCEIRPLKPYRECSGSC